MTAAAREELNDLVEWKSPKKPAPESAAESLQYGREDWKIGAGNLPGILNKNVRPPQSTGY